MEGDHIKIFHVLPTNMSKKPVHILECMIAKLVTDSTAIIIAVDDAQLNTNPELISTWNCKPQLDRYTQLKRYKEVEAKDDKILSSI